MSASLNEQVFRQFHEEILLKGHLDRIDDWVDPEVVSHNPIPGQAPGAEGFRNALRAFRAAFPDLTSRITLLVADGDLLACRFEASASHRGEFMGLAPTGRAFAYEEMVFVRFRNGRIVEHWAVADTLDMMEKMGAITFNG